MREQASSEASEQVPLQVQVVEVLQAQRCLWLQTAQPAALQVEEVQVGQVLESR